MNLIPKLVFGGLAGRQGRWDVAPLSALMADVERDEPPDLEACRTVGEGERSGP